MIWIERIQMLDSQLKLFVRRCSRESGMCHEAYAIRIQSFYGRKYKQSESGMKSV